MGEGITRLLKEFAWVDSEVVCMYVCMLSVHGPGIPFTEANLKRLSSFVGSKNSWRRDEIFVSLEMGE